MRLTQLIIIVMIASLSACSSTVVQYTYDGTTETFHIDSADNAVVQIEGSNLKMIIK